MKKYLKYIITAIYLAGGILVWVDFRNSPPDGLANVGIILYVLPATIVGGFISDNHFPYFDGRYYVSHFRFFLTSLLTIAALIFCICELVNRFQLRRRNRRAIDINK
jgi:hypothetical protein